MPIFGSFNVLIPQEEYLQKWSVIACDQFTSQPEYWKELRTVIGDAPSALHCILPEAELCTVDGTQYNEIRDRMNEYLSSGIFREYTDSFVYVERTLQNGEVRRGIIGVIDLEEYNFCSDSTSAIRATEKTVMERIPPRMKVRKDATLDFSHVLLLCDDERNEIVESLQVEAGFTVYDFDLLQGGGHIKGRIVNGDSAEKLRLRLDEYVARKRKEHNGMVFSVGDGNHSLASAKSCYEEMKKHCSDIQAINSARYAVVELENIRDRVQKFEPIHRIVYDVDVHDLLEYLQQHYCTEGGYPIEWVDNNEFGTIYLDKQKGVLSIGVLQKALDSYLECYHGVLDYIHGDETLKELTIKRNGIGFLLPSISIDDFFRSIVVDGVLPRKTFSMGDACEKRYYLETRKL